MDLVSKSEYEIRSYPIVSYTEWLYTAVRELNRLIHFHHGCYSHERRERL